MQPVDCARMAVDVASDGLASDIVMLDLKGISDFTDYFVILTADSSRQMRSLAEEIEGSLTEAGAGMHHVEGTHSSGWMLLDFGDVIVHLNGAQGAGLLPDRERVGQGRAKSSGFSDPSLHVPCVADELVG